MAMEYGDLSSGDRIALVYPPGTATFHQNYIVHSISMEKSCTQIFLFIGIDLVVAVYACLYAGKDYLLTNSELKITRRGRR